MAKTLSAVLAAALISLSASSFANGESPYPMSVNETGPVLAQQASDRQAEGVAGRPGLGIESSASAVYEVQTPSGGGLVDD